MQRSAFLTRFLFAIYAGVFGVYALFSFSLTDPNLVLTSFAPYWQFQQWMWQTFFVNAQLLTQVYVGVVIGLVSFYLLLAKKVSVGPKLSWQWFFPIILCVIPLLASYNALSHDVFNYMFNAKMVMQYQADPHQRVALDFAADEWTRFMHNTHTTAPYGYGWTVLSLVPYVIGMGKFTLTWLLFRGFSVLSFLLLVVVLVKLGYEKLTGQSERENFLQNFFLLCLNPLFLIEVVSNIHNDLWMMVPAVTAVLLLLPRKVKKSGGVWTIVLASGLLLGISVFVKLATILLVPVWLLFVFERLGMNRWLSELGPVMKRLVAWVKNNWPHLAVFLMLLPLLTSRSQQFHPWYLSWLLVWLPFIQWKWLRNALVVLSVSSLFRYVPWLLNGHFTDAIIWQQKLITWVPLLGWLGWEVISAATRKFFQK